MADREVRRRAILLAVACFGTAGCSGGRSVEEGLDPATAEQVASIRAGGEPVRGGTESDGVQTEWKAWVAAGEPLLIEEGVQVRRRATTRSLYLFEDGRLVFYRQTGQRPTSVPGGVGLEEVEIELRWTEDGHASGAKRVERRPVELPAWEEAVARERARDLRALVRARIGSQEPPTSPTEGSSADASP